MGATVRAHHADATMQDIEDMAKLSPQVLHLRDSYMWGPRLAEAVLYTAVSFCCAAALLRCTAAHVSRTELPSPATTCTFSWPVGHSCQA